MPDLTPADIDRLLELEARATPGGQAMSAMGDKIDRLRKEVERLTSERDEAQKLAYVPGLWKCAKCKCTVISNEMHAQTGRFRANNEPQRCPNDCGPMWRVSERDAGNDLVDRLDVLSDRASRAEAKVEELTKALREIERYCPATAEMTAAHIMAQIASDALAGVEPGRPAAGALNPTGEGDSHVG